MPLSSSLADFAHDLLYALRTLRRDRGFTLVAVLTLALGIGATTSLFAVLHAVVLNPLPFPESSRLVDIATTFQGGPGAVSVGNYFVMKERARTFDGIAARSSATFNLTEGSEPERVLGAHVTASYFDVLGLPPLLGRVFTEAEDQPGEARVAVLSHGLFTRRFGRDHSVVGRSILLSGRPHTVIGVMPQEFAIPEEEVEIWTPIAFGPERSFDAHYLGVTARLSRGVTSEQLNADIAAITAAVREAAPRDNEGRAMSGALMLDRIVGNYQERLYVLLGAVSLVFLIACVNVASLLMARGAARQPELAVRAALGAGRLRIARQLMTEALVLCFLGAVAGLTLAAVALPVLVAGGPADLPRLTEARIGGVAIAAATLVAFVATLIAGLAPALRESRAGLSSSAGQASRGAVGGVGDRLRQAFVAIEVALALMLLMGAGLLIRSGENLGRVSPGFDPQDLLAARIALPALAYPGEDQPAAAVAQMVANLEAAPGVERAAASTRPPLIGDVNYGLRIEGRATTPRDRVNARMQLITPGYLETMGMPVRLGRGFSAADRRDAPRVIIVNETLARLAWPNQSALGKRIACCEGSDAEPSWKEIVGVVADTRARGIAAPALAEFYLPMDQAPRRSFDANGRSITLVARATNGNPATLTPLIRDAVRRIDASVPLYDVATMASRVEASTAVMRFNRLLLSCLAFAGLALAAIGIYGVIAYLVGQRTREISVRMALGAMPRDVILMVLRQGLSGVAAGVVLGTIGVFAQARAMNSVLFGVSGGDPWTLLTVAGVLALFAVGASVLPAWRASKITPTRALAEP
jgi:predicted permease